MIEKPKTSRESELRFTINLPRGYYPKHAQYSVVFNRYSEGVTANWGGFTVAGNNKREAWERLQRKVAATIELFEESFGKKV